MVKQFSILKQLPDLRIGQGWGTWMSCTKLAKKEILFWSAGPRF